MATLFLIIHVLACLFLVFMVLIQSGKGAEMGATFGGSSQTLFGSRGAATFLNKMTTVAAVVFMITSLGLTMVTTKKSSVIMQAPEARKQQQGQPMMPQQPIPAQPLNQPAAK